MLFLRYLSPSQLELEGVRLGEVFGVARRRLAFSLNPSRSQSTSAGKQNHRERRPKFPRKSITVHSQENPGRQQASRRARDLDDITAAARAEGTRRPASSWAASFPSNGASAVVRLRQRERERRREDVLGQEGGSSIGGSRRSRWGSRGSSRRSVSIGE